MNVSISPIMGFMVGVDYIEDVEAEDGSVYNLLRISLGIFFVHIILGSSA